MTLEVPFDNFAEAAQKFAHTRFAFLSEMKGGYRVTAATPEVGALVVSKTHLSFDEAKLHLEKYGLIVSEGRWSSPELQLDAPETTSEYYVGAVAYASEKGQPGLWVDAFSEHPTALQVLQAMYDEFSKTGELVETTFEEFARESNPTVVIVSPEQLQSYIAQKEPCSQ